MYHHFISKNTRCAYHIFTPERGLARLKSPVGKIPGTRHDLVAIFDNTTRTESRERKFYLLPISIKVFSKYHLRIDFSLHSFSVRGERHGQSFNIIHTLSMLCSVIRDPHCSPGEPRFVQNL